MSVPADPTTEAILTAAGELFAAHGVDGPGMGEVAAAAGCSRATLYRRFPDRARLWEAFAAREAAAIGAEVSVATRAVPATDRRVETVLAILAAVRRRPYLQAWYAHGTRTLDQVLGDPAVRGAFDPEHTRSDPDRDAWTLRVVLSLLTSPEPDPGRERELLQRFLP